MARDRWISWAVALRAVRRCTGFGSGIAQSALIELCGSGKVRFDGLERLSRRRVSLCNYACSWTINPKLNTLTSLDGMTRFGDLRICRNDLEYALLRAEIPAAGGAQLSHLHAKVPRHADPAPDDRPAKPKNASPEAILAAVKKHKEAVGNRRPPEEEIWDAVRREFPGKAVPRSRIREAIDKAYKPRRAGRPKKLENPPK